MTTKEITNSVQMRLYTSYRKSGYNYGKYMGTGGHNMAMRFDKEMINPNIPRTIRFTPVLFDWLMQVKERENLSFNQVVLQCCKNCMTEDHDKESAEDAGSR